MLPFPDLNEKSFEETALEAIKNIELYTSLWSGGGVHDPGVMLIELFAWLKIIQQQKINRVSVKTLGKLLALADISFRGGVSAVCQATLRCERDMRLPAGTKFRLDDTVFETKEENYIVRNEIKKHYEPYIFGNPAAAGCAMTLFFAEPLSQKRTVSIYIDVQYLGGIKRNPITEPSDFAPTSIVKWEYYGESDGKRGWHNAEVLRDTTYNLLFSGEVCFKIEGTHISKDGFFPIRGRLERNLYEYAPFISDISLNSLSLLQQDTKCMSLEFSIIQLKENKMLVDCFLAYVGVYELYVRSDGNWIQADKLGIEYTLVRNSMSLRLELSCHEALLSALEGLDVSAVVIKLVLYDESFYAKRFAGNGTGFSNQVIKPVASGIRKDSLELIVRNKNGICEIFKPADNLDNSDSGDARFIFNEYEGIILFGDNEKGLCPPAGSDIIYTSLVTTSGENGNIKENLLYLPDYPQLFQGISIERHRCAYGGKNAETIEDVIARIPHELTKIHTAVTKSDYEILASAAQGLMIKDAVALPLYDGEKQQESENTVTVIVEPFTDGSKLLDCAYLQNVKTALNKARLAATRIHVLYPKYIGIEIYCEVVAKEHNRDITERIETDIRTAIDGIPLGSAVSYTYMCETVEGVYGVVYTKYLSLDFSGNANKNIFGDIEIQPHAKAYLKKANIIAI